MSHWVYIIYSQEYDRYYVGESQNPEQRLIWHNEHIFSRSSTRIATDWSLVWKLECESISVARKIEGFIKKMKSRSFIERLIKEDGPWLISNYGEEIF